jgi:hypothetical protein
LWGFEADIFSSNTGQCDISNVRQDVTFQLWQDTIFARPLDTQRTSLLY